MSTRPDRRGAVDRVFGDRSDFPKVGDTEDQVVYVSGMPSPNTEMQARGSHPAADPGHHHLSPRQARLINAQSGETLDESMQRTTMMRAARKAENEKAAAGATTT